MSNWSVRRWPGGRRIGVLGISPDAVGVPNRLVIRRSRSIGRDLHLLSVRPIMWSLDSEASKVAEAEDDDGCHSNLFRRLSSRQR
jgi:hypothetical protein